MFAEREFSENDFILGMQRGFITCAEWSESPLCEERAQEEGTSYIEGNGFTDAAQKAFDDFVKGFYERNKTLLHESGLHPDQCGHDLWLTVHGHGAGFWDRGIGDIGEKLSDICRKEKEWHVWPGEDGLLHAE